MEPVRIQATFNDIPRKFFFELTTESGLTPNNLFLTTSQLHTFFQKYLNLQNFSTSLNSKSKSNIISNIKKEYGNIVSDIIFFIDEVYNRELIMTNCLTINIDQPNFKDNFNFENFKQSLGQKTILSEKDFIQKYFEVLELNYLNFNQVNCVKQNLKSAEIMNANSRFLFANKRIECDILFQLLNRHNKSLSGFQYAENWSIRNSLPSAMDFLLEQNIITEIASENYLGLINLYMANLPDDSSILSSILKNANFQITTEGDKNKIFLETLTSKFPSLDDIHNYIVSFNLFWDQEKLENIFQAILFIGCMSKHLNSPQKIVRVRKLSALFFEKLIFNQILQGILSNIQLEMNDLTNQKLLTMLISILSLFRFSLNHQIYSVICKSFQMDNSSIQTFLINFTTSVIQKLSEGFFIDYQILIVYLISICESYPQIRQLIFTPNFLRVINDFFTKNKSPHTALKIIVLLLSTNFEDLDEHTLRLIQNILVMFISDYKQSSKPFILFLISSFNSCAPMPIEADSLS
jgi:hypothetical protein